MKFRHFQKMTENQLLLLGPAFAILALMFFIIPVVRPRVFTCSIGWLGACMWVPMVTGFMFNSFGLISLAFLIKPIAAMLSTTLFFAYVAMCRSKRFPLPTAIPSLMMLLGSIADIHAVRQLANGWGGASC